MYWPALGYMETYEKVTVRLDSMNDNDPNLGVINLYVVDTKVGNELHIYTGTFHMNFIFTHRTKFPSRPITFYCSLFPRFSEISPPFFS